MQLPDGPKSVAFFGEHPYERYAAQVLVAAVMLCAIVYVYCVVASVLNITARKDALRQTAEIESSIGILEEQYFSMSQDITPESAAIFGLAPVSGSSFVYRPGTVGVASTEHDEI